MSLVPSTTETVWALGAGDRVVGVTRFCLHPEEARERTRVVGGTKNPSIEKILALEPDLVLANEEENRREDVEELRLQRVPVHVAFPRNLGDATSDIRFLGELLGEAERARSLAEEIDLARKRLTSGTAPFRYLYFIWRRPYMVAAPGTFIDALLSEVSGINAAPRDRGRYPDVTIEDIEHANADVILLSSEPFPFREEHRTEILSVLGRRASPIAVLLVDGELLSWHGARLRLGLPYLEELAGRIRDR